MERLITVLVKSFLFLFSSVGRDGGHGYLCFTFTFTFTVL